MHSFIIKKNDSGQRLDKFLSKALPSLPQSLMYKYIRTKKIKVNRKRCEISTKLSEGDEILLFIKDEFFEKDAPENAFRKLSPKLSLVYEDENILLVNKRAGMLVHSDDSEDVNTLISHIKAYLYNKGEYNPDDELSFAPALCNRIDRNTEGIVIAAKNAEALRLINERIKSRDIKKKYLAAVHGRLSQKEGVLKGWLTKDGGKNLVTVYKEKPRFPAKEIITGYKVLKEKDDYSLVEVDLITGRTHQIRAHFASIGHPLVGDGKYSVNKSDKEKGIKFQALASYKVTFAFDSDDCLSGLSQKTFAIDRSKIWFVCELFGKEK